MQWLHTTTRTLVAGMLCAIAAVSCAPPTAEPPQRREATQTLVCKDDHLQVVAPCDLGYSTRTADGKITYDIDAAGANETMQFTLHGLEPDTWYLVTLQDPTGGKQFSAHGAACLFGIKHTRTGLEFCDAAMVRTDCQGTVRTQVPTDAGLTGMPAPACDTGNIPTLRPAPHLGTGTYSGLTLAVQNVGLSPDGTAPDCQILPTGGTAELFEQAPLPDFTAS
jgi:hypothetical protein